MMLRVVLVLSCVLGGWAFAGPGPKGLTRPKSAAVDAVVSRRDAVVQSVALASFAALGAATPAMAAVKASTATVQNVEAFNEEARNLRQALRKDGANAGDRAKRELGTVLRPLQQTMEAVAGGNRDAKTQALLLKGHLLEFDQALKANDWAPYKSRSTGVTYPGGKAERELEEVEETVEAFLKLVSF